MTIWQRQLNCGCEQVARDGKVEIVFTCAKHGGGPLSFGRVTALQSDAMACDMEHTQPIPQGYMREHVTRNCVRCGQQTLPNGQCYCGATPANVLAESGYIRPDKEMQRCVDALQRHTLCDVLTPEELKLLRALVQCERVTLLNERRVYVFARRGDTTRFQELIRQIDGKLFSVTRLGDKLSALTAGESDDQRTLNG